MNAIRIQTKASLVLAVCLAASAASVAQDQSFEQEVVPILQQHCFSCHNSDDHKGDFALQTKPELLGSGYVEPGDADGSHFLTVLRPVDGKPPAMPKDSPPLTKSEIETLEKWITEGAQWPDGFDIPEPAITSTDWWSWNPIVRQEIPKLENPYAARFPLENAVDAFILNKLIEKGLKPSAPANRRVLIRRVYYDLLGLPPTPEQIETFVESSDPMAYERLIDDLLASPAYGERWARHWLDIVKYADTAGYDKDKLRPNAWPYRDYVIKSFNQDKPYARFVREQLAGDQLFPGTEDGILGLGFVAAGPWDFIGHVEVPETKIDGRIARYIDRDEMVTNAMNTFVSTTVQCARCHNHKFDAVTQQHYYNLQSVFAAVDKAERSYGVDPKVTARRQELESKIKESTTQLAAIQKKIEEEAGPAYTEALAKANELAAFAVLAHRDDAYGFHSAMQTATSVAQWAQVDLGESKAISEIRLHPCSDDFGGIGNGFGFPVRFKLEVSDDPEFKSSTLVADQTADDYPNLGIAYYAAAQDVTGRYIRLTATKLYDRNGSPMFAMSELQALSAEGTNLALNKVVSSSTSIEAPARWARKNLTDGKWPTPKDVAKTQQWAERMVAAAQLVVEANTPERRKQTQSLTARKAAMEKELAGLPTGRMVFAAATEFKVQGSFKPTMGKPRSIKVLHRGDILQERQETQPGTIPLLEEDGVFSLDAGHTEGDRRVAFAEWVVRKDQPLTWRSIVNRIWQYHFGQGIVSTPNDLGRMGQLPTHPELLDWLALEFRDQGQSFKHLHRLILLSSTYRQSSAHHEENSQIDSSNQFLWRMNRRKLSAEEIRDSVLHVSGRLSNQMGGPGYYLFKLEHPQHSPHYEYHLHDPNDVMSHRRSVYRFIVRSQPDPFMTILDCADSSKSTPQRVETLTSIQALALLNNKFNLAMAQHFATDLMTLELPEQQRIEVAFARLAGRQPNQEESAQLAAYAREHGLANLCRVLYNLHEFVFVE